MSWQTVLDAVDATESWIANQSYWVQIAVLLVVLLPLAWVVAGLIDRIVEKALWPYSRREFRAAAEAAARQGARLDARHRELSTHHRELSTGHGDTDLPGHQVDSARQPVVTADLGGPAS